MLIFSTIFVRNAAHSKKNSARNYNKCVLAFTQSTRYSSHTFSRTLDFLDTFSKNTNTIFMSIHPVEAMLLHTDEHDKTKSLFTIFQTRIATRHATRQL